MTATPASKPVGRPSKLGRAFDSMSAASGALHINMHVLKAIKAKGCDAFRWGKVYELPLRAWIEANETKCEDDDYQPTETEDLADRAGVMLWRHGRSLAELKADLAAKIAECEARALNPTPIMEQAA